jgi:hypothetical protein
MSIIPLDVQRRCERRWAARFVRQAPEPSSERSEYEKQVNGSACPQSQKETRRGLSRRAEVTKWENRNGRRP